MISWLTAKRRSQAAATASEDAVEKHEQKSKKQRSRAFAAEVAGGEHPRRPSKRKFSAPSAASSSRCPLIEWDEELSDRLLQLVMYHGPKWRKLGQMLSAPPEQVESEYVGFCKRMNLRRNIWTDVEDDLLRNGIIRATGSLLPCSSDVPWHKVGPMLLRKSDDQCKEHWHNVMLPNLQASRDSHGHPVPVDVFHRLILRRLQEGLYSTEEQVHWQSTNRFWTARMNEDAFRKLQRSLPARLQPMHLRHCTLRPPNPADWDEPELQDQVSWLGRFLRVEQRRLVDDRQLRLCASAGDVEDEARDADALSDNEAARLRALFEVVDQSPLHSWDQSSLHSRDAGDTNSSDDGMEEIFLNNEGTVSV